MKEIRNNENQFKDPSGLAPEKEKGGEKYKIQRNFIVEESAEFVQMQKLMIEANTLFGEFLMSFVNANEFADYMLEYLVRENEKSGGGGGSNSGGNRLGTDESNNGIGDVNVNSNNENGNKQAVPGIIARYDDKLWIIPKSELIGIKNYEVDAQGVYNIKDDDYELPSDSSFPVPDDKAMIGILDKIYDDMNNNQKYEHGGVIHKNGEFEYGGPGNECDAIDPIKRVVNDGDYYYVHDHKHSLSVLKYDDCGKFYPSQSDFNTANNLSTYGILVGRGYGREAFIFYNYFGVSISVDNEYWINRRK